MRDDKMPDVIYVNGRPRGRKPLLIGTLTARFGTAKVNEDTTYYSESHVQQLIDQAKAEQRDIYTRMTNCDYFGEDGELQGVMVPFDLLHEFEAILNAETDK
jgi:hypothetical protein